MLKIFLFGKIFWTNLEVYRSQWAKRNLNMRRNAENSSFWQIWCTVQASIRNLYSRKNANDILPHFFIILEMVRIINSVYAQIWESWQILLLKLCIKFTQLVSLWIIYIKLPIMLNQSGKSKTKNKFRFGIIEKHYQHEFII